MILSGSWGYSGESPQLTGTNVPNFLNMTKTTPALFGTSASSTASGVSRRGFLLGAAAATAAVPVLGSGLWSPAAAATLPLVTPVWSETVRRSFGIAVQPNMRLTPYGRTDAWPIWAANMNVAYIRGKLGPRLPETPSLIQQCRTLGLKWVMAVIPEDWSMTHDELRAVLAYIRDNAADICIGIEGYNEPNNNRDGSAVRTDWAQATVAYQRVIKEFVAATPSMSHVSVIGPSPRTAGGDESPPYLALRDAGIVPFMDQGGMHSYPAGAKPDTKVDYRLGIMATAYGSGMRTFVSETGYNNAMNSPLVGPRPVPNDVAATYGPRSLLEYFNRGCNSVRYELLSEPDPTNAEPEYSYGVLNCPSNDPSTWSAKPEYTAMQRFLAALKDTAPSHTPAPVALQVTAPTSVKWTVVAKSDGSTSLLAYVNGSVWDAVKRVRTTVTPVDVTIADQAGVRVVKVGADVVSIPLR